MEDIEGSLVHLACSVFVGMIPATRNKRKAATETLYYFGDKLKY